MRRLLLAFLLASVVLPLRADSLEEIQGKISELPASGHSRARASLYDQLGTWHYKQGRYKEAADAFEEALLHKASRALRRHIYVYLGKSYESQERPDKAIAAYEEAVKLERKDWRRHRDLANLYETVKLYRKAVESYTTALRFNAKEQSVYFARGRTWRKMGITGFAENDLVKALELGFSRVIVDEELSLVYEEEGRFRDAAMIIEKDVNGSSPTKNIGRIIYLGYLANIKPLAVKWLGILKTKKDARESVPFYENLVEFMSAPRGEILTLKASDPTLQCLLESVNQ